MAAEETDGADIPTVVVITDTTVDPHVVMVHEPNSMHAENYRAFRTNLLAMGRGKGARTIVFTSALKGEGKSVTVANVGVCLAEAPGTRVCMVDADFRAPRIEKLLGLGPGPGLTEVLAGETPLAQALVETRVRNLFAIRAGRTPKNPSELLGSDRVKNLFDALKTEFTHILCDTPPVHPYTDAAVLGARADGVILVVRMDHTERERSERSRQILERAGANVIGAFVTALQLQDPGEIDYYRELEEEAEGA